MSVLTKTSADMTVIRPFTYEAPGAKLQEHERVSRPAPLAREGDRFRPVAGCAARDGPGLALRGLRARLA